jgi:hypothetical protein
MGDVEMPVSRHCGMNNTHHQLSLLNSLSSPSVKLSGISRAMINGTLTCHCYVGR